MVVVSTRPVNLIEEAERSARLSGASSRGFIGRVILLDASNGDLADFVQYAEDHPSKSRQEESPDLPPTEHRNPTDGVPRETERSWEGLVR